VNLVNIARNEKGFTLIELMVVLIIIGILAAIAIPVVSKQADKAKVKRAVGELKSMKTIVDIHMVDIGVNATGAAPTTDDNDLTGIKAVLEAGGVTEFNDPWGNPYYYRRDDEDKEPAGSDGDGVRYIIFSEDIIHGVVSHGYGLTVECGVTNDVAPEHEMEKVLFAADELTGLIWAAALMRPSKSTKDMELKSLKKKYKNKGFAAGCSRELIERGANQLGWELDKLLTMTLQAMAASEDTIKQQMEEQK
jgi:type II secretion system protein G